MNLDSIRRLGQTPRTITKELESITPKPWFFLPWAVKAWERTMIHGQIVLVGVVQGNEDLFEPREAMWGEAVLAWTTDPQKSQDPSWMEQLLERIQGCRTQATNQEEALIGAHLMAEESSFDLPLPRSLTGGAPGRVCTRFLDPACLPGKVMPANRLLVGLMDGDGPALVPPTMWA